MDEEVSYGTHFSVWHRRRPGVGPEDGQTVVLAFDGTEFRPVGLMEEDGIWFFL